MLRLHQTFGAHAGRVREIDQDVVRFGRLPTNDFAFDAHADLDASGNHAEIRREDGRWVLVDVGSRNGTLVNGRPVQRSVLEGGEEIEFGTGGPRVRVEIVQGGRGMATAPATPIAPDALGGPISPQGPTALAPALGSVRPIPPSAPPPPRHAGAPQSPAAIPTPVWPGPAKAPFVPPPPTPAPAMVGAPPAMVPSPAPIPPPSASGSPKLYGQRTVEQMIQSAVSQAQSAPGAGGGPAGAGGGPAAGPVAGGGAASGKPHDTAFIRQVAEEAAGQRSRGMMFVLGIVLALFFLTLCGVSGIIAILWAQASG